MDENTLNAGAEEVVQPQEVQVGNAPDTNASEEGVVQPQTIDTDTDVGGEETNVVQPFRSFATREEYQSEIDNIVGSRLGDVRSIREQADKFAGVKKMMCELFGNVNEEEALQAFERSYYEAQAEKSGIPVDTQIRLARQEEELNTFRSEKEKADNDQRISEIVNDWRRQEEELKKDIPDFSLDAEISNKMFHDYVEKGLSIAEAYYLTHRSDILTRASSVGAAVAVNNIQQKNNRPSENGAGGATGGSVGIDVSKLTEDEMNEINERVRRGERVDFK